jgi:hypothetical protein
LEYILIKVPKKKAMRGIDNLFRAFCALAKMKALKSFFKELFGILFLMFVFQLCMITLGGFFG